MLVEIYPAFEKIIAWLKASGLQHIRAAAGWRDFGDWLATAETLKSLHGAAYFAHNFDIMSRIADLLDKKDHNKTE